MREKKGKKKYGLLGVMLIGGLTLLSAIVLIMLSGVVTKTTDSDYREFTYTTDFENENLTATNETQENNYTIWLNNTGEARSVYFTYDIIYLPPFFSFML